MRHSELIAESTTPDGESLTLSIERGEHVVRVRGETLMSARLSGSEQAMARLAFEAGGLSGDARILVGGLGMGFTLRAVLDRAGPKARVRVVELLAEVVRWNQGPLAAYANRPLDDPRVSVVTGDLVDQLSETTSTYSAILLDIDNGPEAFTVAGNERLYRDGGLALLRAALSDGGVLVLWSAFRSTSFERRLARAGFDAQSIVVRARGDVAKGARHTLFLAAKSKVGGRQATAGSTNEARIAKARRRRGR